MGVRNDNGSAGTGRDTGATERERRRIKKPYQRPGILSREVWEAVAGVCSGAQAKSTMPPCVGPLSS